MRAMSRGGHLVELWETAKPRQTSSMRIAWMVRASFFCALLALISAVSGINAVRADPIYNLAEIDAHIEETLAANKVRGAAIAIVDGGEIVFLSTYGTDGRGEPVTDQTAFSLGSMSKAFTALAALRLVDEGKIELGTPVTTLLPELDVFDPGGAARATLADFLTHTSGLPARTRQLAPSATLAEHVSALQDVELASAPGEQHIYTSANYLVAARMLEVAAGEPFEDILTSRVLSPLGFDGHAVSDADRTIVGHRYLAIWPVAARLSADKGRLSAATLSASAAEMARFLQFQLGDGSWGGVRLLYADTFKAMHEGTAQGEGFRYAFGWREGRMFGHRAIHHGGLLPDHQGKMILLPEQRVAVVVLLNTSSTLPLPLQPTSHRLAGEIAGYLVGEEPRLPWPAYRTWLMVFWGVLAAVLLHQTYTVARVLAGRDPAPRPVRVAAVDAAIMLALVIGLPLLLELSWPQIVGQTPDFALWMAAMLVLTLVGGLGRTVWRR